MSKKDWTNLIAREFNCDNGTAAEMYRLMCAIHQIKEDAKDYDPMRREAA